MNDEFISQRLSASSTRGGVTMRAVMGTSLLAFIGGAALIGWLVWDNRIDLADSSITTLASVGPSHAASPSTAASPSQAALGASIMEQRIAAMETRLGRIDTQARAIEGDVGHAEALLVAFAVRRAIDRGAPLGTLADQLRLRFGNAQPGAVQTVIEAAKQPVTLDQLAAQLETLAPLLTNPSTSAEGGV